MQQTLFLLVGYPGSGKSTFAKQFAKDTGAVRLSADSFRAAIFDQPREHQNKKDNARVYKALGYAMHEVLSAGHSVLCDAPNDMLATRQAYYKIAASHNVRSLVLWFETPEDSALQYARQQGANDEDLEKYRLVIKDYVATLDAPADEPHLLMSGGDQYAAQKAAVLAKGDELSMIVREHDS